MQCMLIYMHIIAGNSTREVKSGTWIAISQSGMMMPDGDSFERNTTIEDR